MSRGKAISIPSCCCRAATPCAREAQRLVAAMAGKPFIFNLGHGVMQPTPPEHVAELVAAVRGA